MVLALNYVMLQNLSSNPISQLIMLHPSHIHYVSVDIIGTPGSKDTDLELYKQQNLFTL